MGAIFGMVGHLLKMFIGGTADAVLATDGVTELMASATYTGFFGDIWGFMIEQPILLIGLAMFLLGVIFVVGKKAIGMIKP